MAATIPTITLNNGRHMPAVGLGTWQMDDAQAEKAVLQAIDLGYRHFDTAFIYHNEVAIGKAVRQKIREGVIKREDVFITSKLWCTSHSPEAVLRACHRSHRYLSLDYIDLYLVHWPFGLKSKTEPLNPQVFDEFDSTSLEETWREMEKCVDEGLVRSIGVSNYNSVQLARIANAARIKPVINQVECHVGLPQHQLLQFCREWGVAVAAHSPLGAPYRPGRPRGAPSTLEQPALAQLAHKHGKTPAQIALRYVVQLGAIPLPKASSVEHMRDNLKIFDFKLDKREMETLDRLDKNDRLLTYPLARHHLDWPFKIPF
ncbi:1,5-anhydro-D-fructose reductase-like isoform X2 [Homalodisca vitripennis]|uniref:1,5-anhydro-D-fructose reductase-like isoform X1 n=1 Tax=Homalodisca vitripennis TaxID=197043 RepID=UPI001EEA026C|nr:1,5-anhydro-D-fructose reductase-like isoform X1 [Homalodisca vitripennis]XP_046671342.1 1,5-anhydro-D-fructose reductase-like isoform X2 [Homalodisca vitripennis]